jgi:hypothetical protein
MAPPDPPIEVKFTNCDEIITETTPEMNIAAPLFASILEAFKLKTVKFNPSSTYSIPPFVSDTFVIIFSTRNK